MSFTNLPEDIIVRILDYDNKIKYRNGKFMTQLQINDETRRCLNKISSKYQYFTGKSSEYWNSYVELFANHGETKYIVEYNNYLSNFDEHGTCISNKITYSFIVKSLLHKRIVESITANY
jgi:hypothetical protein